MVTQLSWGRRIGDAIAMLVVALLSLGTLIYVAFGEAKLNYERFSVEKLVSQGQVTQSVMDAFLRPGLPMQQFAGFSGITEPVVSADPLIDAIAAYDVTGERVFAAGSKDTVLLPPGSQKTQDGIAEIRVSADVLQVVLPLQNRFEKVGFLVLTSPRAKIAEEVEKAFRPLAFIAGAASLAFALFVLCFSQRFRPEIRSTAIAVAFGLKFVGVAVIVVSTLVAVYSQGVQARAKATADSLGQRLDDIAAYNLSYDDFVGIIALFGEYKRLNPDIRAAALITDGKIRAHTDPKLRGAEWVSDPSDFEYTVSIAPRNSVRKLDITVAMPKSVVMRSVVRSVKNFAALFVASAFVAALFMGVARSLQYISHANPQIDADGREKATLNLIRPVFFLAVFVEHLNYAFLPQLMHEQAAASGYSSGFAALPFLAYYFCFAISLIPAGRLDSQLGSRLLIMAGIAMAATGILLLSATGTFEVSVAARALAGVGQGTLFIGVQSYVLKTASTQRKTQGGSAIVFGFQAGMVAGMAIGSLLVSYIGTSGVFYLGGIIALLTMIYTSLVLPANATAAQAAMIETGRSGGVVWRDLGRMLADASFLKTMLLIGVPAKAVLTGVILFALPMLLAKQGFAREDIGQITMVYAGAVILASAAIANYADRTGETERVLFFGGIITAAGLACISLAGLGWVVDWAANPLPGTVAIIVGVGLVGLGHGFVNAPAVTHVAETQLAASLGAGNVAAAYRLVERFGHMLGPVIMGQVFVYFGLTWTVIGVTGIAIFFLAILFPSGQPESRSPQSNPHNKPMEA